MSKSDQIYYNDIKTHDWIQELVNMNELPRGKIDERSIIEVQPSDLTGYKRCHFFAGIGGWELALRLAGWPEDEEIWTGSPPCQPFSCAGQQRGNKDERHLAPTWLDLIRQCKPRWIFGEQVQSAIRFGWLDDLFDAMEREDYTCGAVVLPASFVGSPHIRQRIWFFARLADTHGTRLQQGQRHDSSTRYWYTAAADGHTGSNNCRMADTEGKGRCGRKSLSNGFHGKFRRPNSLGSESGKNTPSEFTHSHNSFWRDVDWLRCRDDKWRPVRSGTFPLADGVSRGMVQGGNISLPTQEARTKRVKGYGNAIVPQLAAVFISAVRLTSFTH